MVLGLRFPREHILETFKGSQGELNSSTTVASTTTGTATFSITPENGCKILKAPSRYSDVRKVIFYLSTGKF
ncbi:MAG: hypothetical protein ACHQX3_07500, partial [Nitrospirales bacterium]